MRVRSMPAIAAKQRRAPCRSASRTGICDFAPSRTPQRALGREAQYSALFVFALALVVVVIAFFGGQNLFGDQAGVLADRGLDLVGDIGILLEEGFGVLAALADALAVVGEPGARLLDHARLDAEVDELAHLGHALAV